MDIKGVDIVWLGHSTFMLTGPEGKRILIDPWTVTNPVCPEDWHGVKPDAILITHGHNDHMGDVLQVVGSDPIPVVAIHEIAMYLASKGVESAIGMNKGGTLPLEAANAAVSMTHALHSAGFVEEDGQIRYLGEAAGFVVHFSNGVRIYHAGDTCLFWDMSLIRDLWTPQVAILPIGGFYTMDPHQAALACRFIQVDTVIPCHYGTFPVLTGTPDLLRAELAQMQVPVELVVLPLGG
ncbi:MAG: metal-dependent hydrolase [Bradymonadales bacterium]|nr:metal-dependent hydrolase [Bradymonadales bacterium]